MIRYKRFVSSCLAALLCLALTISSPVHTARAASSPFVGEIMLFAGDFAPTGWAFCSGQIMPISQNTALFSLLGTTYGGDGKSTFALPNLNDSVPVGGGQGPGLSMYDYGQQGGAKNITLLQSEIPSHTHTNGTPLFPMKVELSSAAAAVKSSNTAGTSSAIAGGNVMAKGVRNERVYTSSSTEPQVAMAPNAITFQQSISPISYTSAIGASLPHNNLAPYTGLRYIIALRGIFPPRDTDSGPTDYVGEIRMFAGNFAPGGYAKCEGQILNIVDNEALFNLLGTTYGGDGQVTFALPDLRGRTPLGTGQGPGLSVRQLGESGGVETVTLNSQQIPTHTHSILPFSTTIPVSGSMKVSQGIGTSSQPDGKYLAKSSKNERVFSTNKTSNMEWADIQLDLSFPATDVDATQQSCGGSQPHENLMPYLAINFVISLNGAFPNQDSGGGLDTPFLGEIRMFGFNFVPNGWKQCNGNLMAINQNQALFALLGTNYGGDGRINFAVPDLRGRVPIGAGESINLGQTGGEERHTLTISELPQHVHTLTLPSFDINTTGTMKAVNSIANTSLPNGNTFAKSYKNERIYSTTNNAVSNDSAILNLNLLLSPTDGSGNKIDSIQLTNYGGSQAHENMKPFLGITFGIATQGVFPSAN